MWSVNIAAEEESPGRVLLHLGTLVLRLPTTYFVQTQTTTARARFPQACPPVNMFRFHKPLDIITVFHKASSPGSVRVANLLKQVSATVSETETATEDQASGHTAHASLRKEPFELNITEDLPTADQLRTILEYVGTPRIPTIVKGATTENEALRRFKESMDNLERPLVVDWNNGKAAAGEKESEILKMLGALPKK
ncbi:hypothetical protein P8C59_009407 [Phyllachora maydis]|uniref:Uncharacterized protein n=1 Tax=Phyllachora maydis TaxID=1825666 RepID=A0AAD9ID48_9PEZI|nr:hypothetical protein P8C59_009407 [Phyllachora maydis]